VKSAQKAKWRVRWVRLVAYFICNRRIRERFDPAMAGRGPINAILYGIV
jgi:hypothetical protein